MTTQAEAIEKLATSVQEGLLGLTMAVDGLTSAVRVVGAQRPAQSLAGVSKNKGKAKK